MLKLPGDSYEDSVAVANTGATNHASQYTLSMVDGAPVLCLPPGRRVSLVRQWHYNSELRTSRFLYSAAVMNCCLCLPLIKSPIDQDVPQVTLSLDVFHCLFISVCCHLCCPRVNRLMPSIHRRVISRD